jgi:hypothetical protein
MLRRFYYMSPDEGGGSGGGGNKGDTGDKGGQKDQGGDKTDLAAEIAALKAQIAKLEGGGKKDTGTQDDPDLGDKARRARADQEAAAARAKNLESAIKFNLKAPEFLKANESLLPKDAADIFAQAEKEKFEDAIEKDAAIKSGLVQSFFSIQSNVDLLTAGQKAMLDDYLKLTKTGKQDKAQQMYDMVFEPAFEMLKRTKRAEALSKGYSADNSDDAYKKKLMSLSKKHYLGEKQ